MAFFTKDFISSFSDKTRKYSFETYDQLLTESIKEQDSLRQYDVFLSHAVKDAKIVLGVKNWLEENGMKVYVDWIDDRHLDRSKVTSKTANTLRVRMRQSKSLLYIATDNSSQSKWMPWELGYFDGYSSGKVAILAILDHQYESFSGQEYLGIYPLVQSFGSYSDSFYGLKKGFVHINGKNVFLESFIEKSPSQW